MAKQFVRQHEPLRVPQGWTEQDRALVIQMNKLLDDLYVVQGKVEQRLAELGAASNMDVANNLTTTDPGFLLDARQGPFIAKHLSSIIGPVEHIGTPVDFNNYTSVGTYCVDTNAIMSACTNRPPTNYIGRLIVWTIGGGNLSGNWAYGGQIYIDDFSQVFVRWARTNGSAVLSFGEWRAVFSEPVYKNATPDTGYTVTEARAYKNGQSAMIYIRNLQGSSAKSGWTTVATLPSEIVPAFEQCGYLANDSTYQSSTGGYVFEARVTPERKIQVYSPPANTAMWGGFTFTCL